MRPPFARLAPERRRRAFIAAVALTLLVGAGLQAAGAVLATEIAPLGIVSFELAGDVETAGRILDSWDSEARIRAGLSLGADYLFLVAYPLAIALGCALVAEGLRPRARRAAALGAALAWAQLAAGALDAVENFALIRLLLGSRASHWPVLAWGCAVPKFAIVAMGMAYAAFGGLAAAALRRRA